MSAGIGEAQTGGALAGVLDWAVDVLKSVLGENTVMTEALDVEEPAVSAEADFAQFCQVVQALAGADVVSVVDPLIVVSVRRARCSL